MRYLIFLFLFVSISCKYNDPYTIPKEKDKIPENKLDDILLEIHLAQNLKYSDQYRNLCNFEPINITDSILKKYGYTKADLDSTLSAYSANPQKLNEIYDKILNRLSTMEGQIKVERQKADTVR